MRVAIEEANQSLRQGNFGYGAVIVKDDKVIARAHDTVKTELDVTAHAEINAIRLAVKSLNTLDLKGCVLFASHDPCNMCGSAILWANISKIVIGLSREKNIKERKGIRRPLEELAEGSLYPVEITRDILSEECRRIPTIRG